MDFISVRWPQSTHDSNNLSANSNHNSTNLPANWIWYKKLFLATSTHFATVVGVVSMSTSIYELSTRLAEIFPLERYMKRVATCTINGVQNWSHCVFCVCIWLRPSVSTTPCSELLFSKISLWGPVMTKQDTYKRLLWRTQDQEIYWDARSRGTID